MKKHGFILLMVACFLVAMQVSADIYAVSDNSETFWIITETKIDAWEDVTDYTVDGERKTAFAVYSKQAVSSCPIGTMPDSGIELDFIREYYVKSTEVKPESLPYIKGL